MRLLIATGGAPHSEAALQLGALLRQMMRTDEVPTILTVVKADTKRAEIDERLLRACALLGLKPFEVRYKVRIGQPAEEILAEVVKGDYELVIVGERPRHRLMTRLLGSTTRRVIERAPCPVVIAKGHPQAIRRILLCESGAMRPSVLSRFASQFAELLSGKINITVLHVMSQISAGPGVSDDQLRADAQELMRVHAPEGELLAEDLRTLTHFDVRSEPKVRHGLVVDEILAEAKSGDYDLVVIGDYQGQGWNRLLLDNLAHKIIIKVDRSVLVVR